jgi:hypothetical protein
MFGFGGQILEHAERQILIAPNPTPQDHANQFNPVACEADFEYRIAPRTVQIRDTGKGKKSVVDDLESVLRKIEHWHQGSIAGYRISLQSTEGSEYLVEWDGKTAGMSVSKEPDLPI